MTKQELQAALRSVELGGHIETFEEGRRAVVDFGSDLSLTFQDLFKLSEAIGTDRINIITSTGWYGEHSHTIEVLWGDEL